MKMGGLTAAQVANATREEPRYGSATRPARVTKSDAWQWATAAAIRQFAFTVLSHL
jgi:hypothetical protein